jgi:hypothetical protein
MNVGVDERRRDEEPGRVDSFVRVGVIAYPGDELIGDRDIGANQLGAEDVDDRASGDGDVRRLGRLRDPQPAAPRARVEPGSKM